jgi:TetR/AcrR family transcriptional regulator, transcriptional repressor for nem operon
MARPRDFDIEKATDRAVRLFWARGYAATTVRQLCGAMKINSGSFYAAFGSKQALFRRALARYVATQPVPKEPSPEAARRWFEVIVDEERTPRGCLLVGSAVEAPLLDGKSRAAVLATMAAVEDFFARCVGERERATVLATAVTAIHVMARAGVPPKQLRVVADRALAAAGL